MKKCERYISVYFGIAIIIAVTGQFSFVGEALSELFLKLTMPLVFVAYGSRLENTKESKWSDEKLAQMAKEFLLPYFWFSLIYILADAVRFFAGTKTVIMDSNYLISDVFMSISFYGVSVLWYLPVLFLAVVIYSLLRIKIKYLYSLIITLVMAIIFIVLPFDNNMLDWGIATVQEIPSMLVLFCMRTVLALLFVSVGEGINSLVKKLGKRKIMSLIIGLIFAALGIILLIFDGEGSFLWVDFERCYIYLPGTILFSAGVFFISYWIGQAVVFEFLGDNARIIYLTMIDFGILGVSTEYVEAMCLKIFSNYFLSHIMAIVSFVIMELVIIVLVNRFLFFLVSKECNKTFGLNKTEE